MGISDLLGHVVRDPLGLVVRAQLASKDQLEFLLLAPKDQLELEVLVPSLLDHKDPLVFPLFPLPAPLVPLDHKDPPVFPLFPLLAPLVLLVHKESLDQEVVKPCMMQLLPPMEAVII